MTEALGKQSRRWRLPPEWGPEEEAHYDELFDGWMNDSERMLGRPRDTIRLLSISDTNNLQDRVMELQHDAYHLRATPYFGREEELARSVDDWQKPAFVNAERLTVYARLLAKLLAELPDERVFILRELCGAFGAIISTSAEVFSHGLAFFDPYATDSVWVVDTDGRNALDIGVFWQSFHVIASMAVFGNRWTIPLANEKGGFYGRSPEDPATASAIARDAHIEPYQLEFFHAEGAGAFHNARLEWTPEWRAALARGCHTVSRVLSPGPEGGTTLIVTFCCPEADK
ncbi:MAG: hypothetical protein ACR2JW_18250 [Thermomicrobiales bacterium]